MARVSAALWRRAWLRAALTLSPPLAWFLVIYLASLVVMLMTAFWTVNPFTNNLQHQFTLTQLRRPVRRADPRHHRPDRPHRCARDGDRRRHRPPLCVLHGQGRDTPRYATRSSSLCCSRSGRVTSPASTRGSSSSPRTAPSTGPPNTSASARRTSPTRTSPWASCSVTSGCLS